MSGPKFSIIIPTYNRADGRLQRALNSALVQAYKGEFEAIVVDDCSTDGTAALFEPGASVYSLDRHFRYVRHERREGRVVARNTGMELALKNGVDFYVHLDSDDCLDAMYLATFAHYAQENPDAKLIVCGVVVHGMIGDPNKRICPAWTRIRNAWMPPVDCNGLHTFFDSGHVGTGAFVFARECYEKVGPLPANWHHPDDISDGFDEWLGLPFGTLGYGSGKRERETTAAPLIRARGAGHIGNPFGEDHCLFQKLSLNYRVHLIQAALYVQYIR